MEIIALGCKSNIDEAVYDCSKELELVFVSENNSEQQEASAVFIEPSGLENLLAKQPVKLLDIGFGEGVKSIEAVRVSLHNRHDLQIHALEMDRAILEKKKGKLFESLHRTGFCSGSFGSITMHWGDARHTIKGLQEVAPFDLIFLDGYGVQQNSELWTVDLFAQLYALLGEHGKLLTHNTSLPVLSGLMKAGFYVGLREHISSFKKGVIATVVESSAVLPLSSRAKQKILETSVGIPYRDPYGVWSCKDILRAISDEVIVGQILS